MKIAEIYANKDRRTKEWAFQLRTLLSKFESLYPTVAPITGPNEGDPVIADEEISSTTLAKVNPHFAFRVQFGNHTYSYPSGEVHNAEIYPAEISSEFRSMMDDAGLTPTAGSLPLAAQVNGFSFPCGAYIVVGKGDAGKTPMAYALAEAIAGDDPDGFELIRYCEPFAGYNKSEAQAGAELVRKMVSHRVIVVDSLKDMMTQMKGGLMDSGLSRGVLPLFSKLSMMASELGCVLIFPINPSSQKDNMIELLAEVARSNVAAAVVKDGSEWVILARHGEGMLRGTGTLKLNFTAGIPSVQVTSTSSITEEKASNLISTLHSFGTETGLSTTGLSKIVRKIAKDNS